MELFQEEIFLIIILYLLIILIINFFQKENTFREVIFIN